MSWPGFRLSLLVLVAATPCCTTTTEWLPPPVDRGAIVFAAEDRGALRVESFELASDTRLILEDLSREDASIAAVAFGEVSLRELGIPSGRIEIVEAGPGTRGLPLDREGLRFFEAKPGASWTELVTAPEPMDQLQFDDPREEPCPQLDIESFTIPGTATTGAIFAAKLDEEHALVVLRDTRLYLADLRGEIQRVEIDGLDAPATAAAADQDDLWIGTAGGSIYRAPKSVALSGFELVLGSEAGIIDRMVISRVGENRWFGILDRERRFWVHDGSGWSQVYQFLDDPTMDRSKDLIAVDDGHLLAVALSEPTIVQVKAGARSVESPADKPVSGFQRAIQVPGFGTLVSATFGELYSNAQGAWARWMSPETSVNIQSMALFRGGVVVANNRGGLELIFPQEKRSCGTLTLPWNMRTEEILVFGDKLLLTGGTRDLADVPVVVVTAN